MSLSGKFEIPSGNCQGNVREFCFCLSVATLMCSTYLNSVVLCEVNKLFHDKMDVHLTCIPGLVVLHMSRLMGKPAICICENKDADQLLGNREADQRLCFRYSDSTIPPLLNSKISSF